MIGRPRRHNTQGSRRRDLPRSHTQLKWPQKFPLPARKRLTMNPLLAHLQRFRADARTRTGDPFITSEVLYQLSYVGKVLVCRAFATPRRGDTVRVADFCCTVRS